MLSRLRLERGGGGIESGRARASWVGSGSASRNAAGRGEESVIMSLTSCAIQSTSSETSVSARETMELLRTGSARSGMDCMKSTEACWDLKVGARMR